MDFTSNILSSVDGLVNVIFPCVIDIGLFFPPAAKTIPFNGVLGREDDIKTVQSKIYINFLTLMIILNFIKICIPFRCLNEYFGYIDIKKFTEICQHQKYILH